jgi:hypothetical protein
MATHEPGSHWWSDIYQTEIRLAQDSDRSVYILPPRDLRIGSGRVATARRMAKAFLVKLGGLFANRPPTAPAVSCTDPLDAYMHACLAAAFFCYISPELYGLTAADETPGATQVEAHPGVDL